MKITSKIRWLLAIWCFVAGFAAPNTRAFSLLGPFEPWMTPTVGFVPETEIGGPMCLSNGYRWNVPVVTYGFDQSFIDYFGTNGVAAVASAISLLNELPPASQLNPANYPDASEEINYTAAGESLINLKAATLFLLLEHLGLAAPDTYVFTLRSFTVPSTLNVGTNGVYVPAPDASAFSDVLIRSYDPVTDLPSVYVNNTWLTYYLNVYPVPGATNAAAFAIAVDPLADFETAVADGNLSYGEFYDALTSDDIGGLLYLYSTNNVNFETLLPDVQSAGANAIVNGAWRPGVDKVTFVPQPLDPLTGAFLPATNEFTDTYLTNGIATRQFLRRVTTQPDFLFSANDLATGAFYDRTGTTNWINNSALNGRTSSAGPGVIPPPVSLVFNKLGTTWVNNSAIDDPVSVSDYLWGSFDASTNPPLAFPPPQSGALPTPVRLALYATGPFDPPVNYRWLVAGTNNTFAFQTSTDLNHWTTLFTVPNNGTLSTYFNEKPASSQRFYRVVPQ